MCPSEDVTFCRSPPPVSNRVDSLYDNEVESDVVFLVGKEPDVWRLPGHKNILSEANEVFRALLVGPLAAKDTTIVIDDVECRAFDYLLKYLYGKDVKFKSVSTALFTLYPAHKYLCSGLVKLCVDYLEENLTTDNVLEIFSHARFYTSSGANRFRCEPSAPPMDSISTASNDLMSFPNGSLTFGSVPDECLRSESETKSLIDCDGKPATEGTIHGLLSKCLQLIDRNADLILLQEAIEDMDADSLREIIKRDTLRVTSEYNVFLALDRWANRECKRRKLVLNSRNRRRLLGDLFYEVRFPYLKPDELIRKPIQTGLLSQSELAVVSALISKSKNLPKVPEEWLPHMERIKRRRTHYDSENLALSQRTYLIDIDKGKGELRRSYSFFRKKKSKDCAGGDNGSRRKSFRSMSVDSCRSDKKCMTRLAEYFLDIFVCLFD